jgi:hypothetical protein
MLFLLNDRVLNLHTVSLAPPVAARRFSRLSHKFISELGAEMFAQEPLLHLNDPEKAARLAALIVAKTPEVNAALFVATAKGCPVEQVAVRYAQVSFEVMGLLYSRQQDGVLSHVEADRQVWRRLAA